MRRVWTLLLLGTVMGLLVAACGDSDDSAGEPATGDAAPETSAQSSDASAATTAAPAETSGDSGSSNAGASGGSLVLGDETIALDRARCFLQEQDAAAGGGKILFVAQAFGTNAAGDEVVLDISRYDEDSQFHGDDIIVDIGDPFSDGAVSLSAFGEVGTVAVDGSRLSADGLSFLNFDDNSEVAGSFEVDC